MAAGTPLRVAHIISNLEIGGAEVALARLIAATQPRGRLTHAVWSLRDLGVVGSRIREHVPVAAARLGPSPRALARWRALKAGVAGFEPDVLQGWMYHGNLAASAVHRGLPRAGLLWNIRNSLRSLEREKFSTRCVIRASRWFARGPAVIVNNSRASARDHVALGYPAGAWKIIPNGFDTRELTAIGADERRQARAALEIGADHLVIGAIGRNHPIKGHDHFVAAIAELCRRGLPVIGVLAGPGWEPDGQAARDAAAKVPGLRFLGPVTPVRKALLALDILCLPSLSEGFPNVVGEAMSCGIPCVVTDTGDAAEIVRDLGEVVPPGDVPALAEGLWRMATRDGVARAALGVACRQRIVERYSLDGVVEAYESLYQEIAERRPRADM
jgi:glycosyltransferase involved in cell wall biosynthesis